MARLTAACLAFALVLASPALAQPFDGPRAAAQAEDAALQFQTYLEDVAKAGERPDFAKPPASDRAARLFDPKQIDALPPATGDDLPWLVDWITAANGANKAILQFGLPPSATPQTDPDAFRRNFTDFEDQEAAAINFLLRLTAHEIGAAFKFIDQLSPAQRTPVRMEGFAKMREGHAATVSIYLGCVAAGMKPANARLISAAFRDTGAAWASAITPDDRPDVLAALDRASAGADEETRANLAAFRTALTK